MMNIFGQLAKNANQPPGGNGLDFLDYPKNSRDKRIYERDGGHGSKCWIWRNPATLDQIRLTAWLDGKGRPPRPGEQILNECRSPNCIRRTHLRPVSDSTLAEMEKFAERYRDPQNWEDLRQVEKDYRAIASLARRRGYEEHVMFRELGIDQDEMNASVMALIRSVSAGTARAQSEPSTAAPESLEPNASQAPSEPAALPKSSPPPLPPFPPAPSGPLGNPTGLAAAQGKAAGEILLSWTPAANAMAHYFGMGEVGTGAVQWIEEGLPGNCRTFTFTKGEAGKQYWFIVIAVQQPSSEEPLIYSEWSNWAGVEL